MIAEGRRTRGEWARETFGNAVENRPSTVLKYESFVASIALYRKDADDAAPPYFKKFRERRG